MLRKRLASVRNDVLLSSPVLALLVEAHLANGEIAATAAAAERFAAMANPTSPCTHVWTDRSWRSGPSLFSG
jgi:hypothetical protein